MARPKRFELLTPRFVDWWGPLFSNDIFAKEPDRASLHINRLAGICKTISSLADSSEAKSIEPDGVCPPPRASVTQGTMDSQWQFYPTQNMSASLNCWPPARRLRPPPMSLPAIKATAATPPE